MKKVLSIAISSLLVGNFAYAETSNENLLVTIQKKIEAKKSGLGSDVQTSSGLASINKSKPSPVDNKDSNSLSSVKPVDTVKNDVKVQDVKTVVQNDVSLPVVNSVSSKTNIEKTSISSVNPTQEICEPVKPKPVKKVVKKVVKPKVSKAPVKNDFEMYKTKNYTPLDFSEKKNNWMTNQQVKLSISGDDKNINVIISDFNDKAIPAEQLNNNQLRVVQVPHNFSSIFNQTQTLNTNTHYSFNKNVNSCSAVFVQYQLKSNSNPINLVKYLDKSGNWSNSLDSNCEVKIPKDSSTNIDYSSNNNLSGLFLDKTKLVANKAFNFNIIFNKFGVNKVPNDLFVYVISSDLSDFKVINPKYYGNAVSGTYFETFLDKGNYILGYTFNEGNVENYFQNINIQ